MVFISVTSFPANKLSKQLTHMSPKKEFLLRLQHKIDTKTKPLGALGQLEDLALQAGFVQQSLTPRIVQPTIIVFAADHGIAATSLVNPYPQAVTAQMVLNFIRGGAAINVFCRQHHIRLQIVDAGVNFNFPKGLGDEFLDAKIGYGTRNYLKEPAMTLPELKQAMDKGEEIVKRVACEGCNCIGFGEMGIGNSSSAALIMSRVTGHPLEDCTGRGTGVNDEQLQQKISTLKKVFSLHFPDPRVPSTPEEILAKVGGFEIAMMAGSFIQAARSGMLIVVDGFIAGAALLLANAMHPEIRQHCIFAHTSGEKGHEKMLNWLGARSLLNLGMRLGEGTGAVLAIPLLQASVNFLNEMASFESAGVSDKEKTA
jgi:nicotinate-nucleotide--dimethylbenzimidazole phosphoribosyltransferase